MKGKIIGRIETRIDARDIDIMIAAAALQNIVSGECLVTIDGMDEYLENLGRNRDVRRLSSISIIQHRKGKGDE